MSNFLDVIASGKMFDPNKHRQARFQQNVGNQQQMQQLARQRQMMELAKAQEARQKLETARGIRRQEEGDRFTRQDRMRAEAERKRKEGQPFHGMSQAQQALVGYLTVDPAQATQKDWFDAAKAKREAGNQPTPMSEYQEKYLELQRNKPRKTPGAPPEHVAKSAGFYDRMMNSKAKTEKLLGDNPDFEPTGGFLGNDRWLPNKAKSDLGQLYQQAAGDWVAAKLRSESGAVITPEEEAAEYKRYWPVYGDSEVVIEQKRQAREVAEKSMFKKAGGMSTAPSADDTGVPPGVDPEDWKYMTAEEKAAWQTN